MMGAEGGVMPLQARQCQEPPGAPRTGRGREDCPQSLQQERGPVNPPVLDSWPREQRGDECLCFKRPSPWYFATAAPGP